MADRAAGKQAPESSPRRVDLGALVVGPLFALMVFANVNLLVDKLQGPIDVNAVVRVTLNLCFYSLLVWAYVTRSAARSTNPSPAAATAAFAATVLPFALPATTVPTGNASVLFVANLLVLAGLAWSVWSMRVLGRSFSILAQARELRREGPYRVVRHPLYLGELTAALGLVVGGFSLAAIAVWGLLLSLQAYRAHCEEAVLSSAFPEYAEYRLATARLVPGLY